MVTKKTKPHASKQQPEDTTGTYVYDKEQGQVVKVSDRVPAVSSKGKGGSFDDMPSPSGCGSCPSSGSCGMGGGGFGGGF